MEPTIFLGTITFVVGFIIGSLHIVQRQPEVIYIQERREQRGSTGCVVPIVIIVIILFVLIIAGV